MNPAEKFIKDKLDARRLDGSYRILKPENDLVDFCSNDYLGFARSAALKELIANELRENDIKSIGSTGSRLISGNSSYIENQEKEIAAFHNSESGLIYNSGYDANVGLFSSLPQKGDTIIMDELAHASIIDGARLSFANRYSFRHNDLASLEEKLKHAKGNCYVVVESVYSMDGDTPPLKDISKLVEQYNAQLIVDEAHAVGLYKRGLICELGLEDKVFARVITFGKALGCHGAIVLGGNLLREYLINFSRSFIYTTAASFHQFAAIKMAYKHLANADNTIEQLNSNIRLLKKSLTAGLKLQLIQSDSAVQCLIAGNNKKAKALAATLQAAGLDVRPILSPTVPKGSERLRICLHAFNTPGEITILAETLNKYNDAG
ncbi:aminotransferase class I/II-fold pyridoxal phosphate-dependent enzyme [Mucilaginibacter ginsenosidivorans]|uniref:Pyridoxal phosphate-dependent aminotransferase family protein n=1 Tax=Mucilaginibacter ginsenosidivorans TaxID=398053 RepID=A0A5B8UZG8_9SPHI|nr:pyridoxal phosphate-dependent aminotransferase family protein [Mucilaginibacter ginsenosidivorans]QEC64560.1 pyridoxal phosphate-dependent aminotransferase family protein [Mucilaginibacter ginsenosidivorans]